MSRESPGASKTHSLKSTSSLTRWLRRAPWGEHSLLVYNTTDEFLQVLVTYLEAGLSQNQACLWVVSALPLEEAKKALGKEVGSLSPYIRKKQLLIVDHLDWYLAGGSFDEETILRELLKKEEEALARGFEGLRFAIDAAWAEKRDWPPLLQYEARLSKALAGRKITALCAYPAQRLSLGELVDITNTHDILIAREGRAFRLTRPMSPIEGKLSQAEEALRNYEFVFESAHDAIFFKDLQSRYILANNKTFAVFGLSREEVIGKNDLEIMPDKKEARKNIEDDQIVFKTGKPREIAKHMTGVDGKEYWFEAIKVPQFDDNGNIIGLVGIARDITEHKRTEEALRVVASQWQDTFDCTDDMIVIIDRDHRIVRANLAMKMAFKDKTVTGAFCYELVHGTDGPPETCLSCTVFETGEFAHMEILEKHLGGRWLDIHTSPIKDEHGKVQQLVHLIRDITERKAADEKIKQRSKELAALNTVTSSISGSLDLKEVARRSLEAVLKAMHLEGGSVYVFDEDQQVLRLLIHLGPGEGVARKHKEIKAGSHHFVWRAAAEKKICMPGSSPKADRVKKHKTVSKPTCSGVPIAVPLISKGKVRGVMVVGAPGKQNYTLDELNLAKAIGSQVAMAIENAELYQEAEQSVEQLRALSARLTEVQEEERGRIVNYLHSNLVQTLTAAKTNLGLLRQQPKKDPVQLRKSLSSVILTIDEAIKETRGLMFDLRTPLLDDLGLMAAVRWYAGVFLKRTGMKVEIKADDFPKDLSHSRRLMLFRIIQELLTNVAKHAKVSSARLTVERRDGMDVIVVADSGVGFDPESLRPSRAAITGLGLVAIREMVSRSKGHLGVDSVPGRGTTVTVRIPAEEPSGQG